MMIINNNSDNNINVTIYLWKNVADRLQSSNHYQIRCRALFSGLTDLTVTSSFVTHYTDLPVDLRLQNRFYT